MIMKLPLTAAKWPRNIFRRQNRLVNRVIYCHDYCAKEFPNVAVIHDYGHLDMHMLIKSVVFKLTIYQFRFSELRLPPYINIPSIEMAVWLDQLPTEPWVIS